MFKKDNAFADFIKVNFGTGKQAALALGVSDSTIYNQIRNQTGGYKVLANIWAKYVETKRQLLYVQDAYHDLAERYNQLVKQINGTDEVSEYLDS